MVGERLKLIALSDPPPLIPVVAVWREADKTGLARQFVNAAKTRV